MTLHGRPPVETRMMKKIFFMIGIVGLILFYESVLAQGRISGVVKNEVTLDPVENVSLQILGTQQGVYTDKYGKFEIFISKIPATLLVTSVGYKKLEYIVTNFNAGKLDLLIRPSVSILSEVSISSEKYRFIVNDHSFSIIDYEMYNGNLLVLIYRRQLYNSELLYLTMDGDTISATKIPEKNPNRLFKDFLGNVHYVSSKGNAFQCFYSETFKNLVFINKTNFDSLTRILKPFLFSTGGRFYFQSPLPGSQGMRIGYFDTTHRMVLIKVISNDKLWKQIMDDQKFDQAWEKGIGQNGITPELAVGNEGNGEFEARARKMFFYAPFNAPVAKLNGDSIALFNFVANELQIFNHDGVVFSSLPIDFHITEENDLADLFSFFIGTAKWKWDGNIISDEYFKDVYTTFSKNGMVEIKKININTGKFSSIYPVPLAFPKKIMIYKGTAYFLNKQIGGEYEQWKLTSFKLN